ncbi:OmpA family protein [Stenotrophomonas sp.]|uniref:DUF7507 domain-containing protein n=2 Tax=Stenotrophomonas sp. TaxID=69392 RepID=UPI0028AD7BB9|nr:OmpA family protein [Stenotrophomonas sp.]
MKLRKQIAGLLDTADRFRYETINIKGSQMDTATSAAGASGALSYVTAQAVMPGNTITLKESMAGGSSTLAQYDKTISCTNTNVGSSTPLPTGAYEPSSPPTIDLQNKGDNVACTITNTPRIVDLAITKSAPPTVEAGKPFDYVLKIENIGTHAATAATYLDTLPTEFADLVAGAVTCRVVLGGALCGTNHVASGKTASGSIASLPPGAAVEIVIKVTAPAIKKSVTNTATVSLATTDTTVGEPSTKRANNTANATTQILSPVLALTKTASPASFVEGVEGSYTLTVTNTGDLATTGSIEVVDVLPVGLTAGVMPSECASVGGTVTCTYIGVLAPGGTKQWTIPVTADVSLVGTSVTNTAAVSGGGSSCTSSAACNSNTVTTPVVGAPKLSIAKSHVGDFIPGVAGIYTLTVSNNGTAATSGMVTVTDTLPTGLSFVSASGAGWACSAAGLTVTCTQSAAIAVGGSAPSIALTVAVALGTANRVTNTANVGGGGDTACPAASRCTTTDITTVNTAASFTVAKHAAVADTNGNTVLGDAGDVITYTFDVSNTGTVDLTQVVVSDAKLPGLVCTIASLPVGATNVACTASGNTYTITAADEAAGEVINTATATAVPPGTIPPPTATTPPVVTPTPATPVASFVLDKKASVADSNGNTVLGDAGDVITYTFLVSNTGTVPLTNVVVRDAMLPSLVCTLASLPVGASNVACSANNNSYVITAADEAAGKVTNVATATAVPPGTITPPTATTPPVITPTPATPVASFTLAKHASVADTNGNTVLGDAGDVITYTFDVSNTGTVELQNVRLRDSMLPNLVCVVASLPVGARNVACVPSNNTYSITAADVAAGKVTNIASASAIPPGSMTPPTASSPPVDTPTLPSPEAGFTLAKHASVADTNGNTVLGDAGDVITYTFDVSNTGSVALSNVKVSDSKLPNLVCTIAHLPVGATNVACVPGNNTYVVSPADVAAGRVVNAAIATAVPPGAITPPTAATPPVETPTPVSPVASFTLDKRASVADTNGNTLLGDAGDVITYTFAVSNTGSVALSNVVVSDAKLPTLVCVVASLSVGASNVACAPRNNTYVITAADEAVGKVINVATASAVPPGAIVPPTAVSPPVETPAPVAPVSGFSLVKQASVADTNGDGITGDAGDLITYTFLVSNTGTVQLRDVVVSDAKLPDLVCVVPTLPVGASNVACAANNNTYRITEQDAEAQEVVNTATATATPPGSITPPQAQATVTTPVLATPPGQLRLSKTAGKSSVNIGDLVRYTIRADNTGEVPVRAATLVDTLPVGFSYVDGSLVVSDDDNTGSIVGISPLRIGGLDIAAGGHATVTYFLRVGAGTGKGVHTNRVVALDATGSAISNQASADVELAGDPLLDDSLVLGTVFDDRNADGWQASATALGVHIQGGFAASAYVANSTTIDRGAGPQPLADHSSPMLHGVDVGRIAGRQSEADPVQRNQVVIRQRLTAADFTDDLVLTTRNGSTLRMRADGTTTVEQSGDVARGMSAEALQVERRYGQDAEGLTVDYIIRNNGIDERGIPGVRVASVEGLLMETDSWGRYHLEGVDGGAWTRGRNFILKVDPATLPQGATFTTENPRVRRVTPGVPVRFDFGVKMPAGEIGGGQQLATVELGEVLFAPESSQIPDEHRPALEAIVGKIRNYNGGTLTIAAEADAEALALARGYAVREHLQAQLAPDLLERTQVQVLTQVGEPLLQLDSAEVLGNVLFDTDRATIKPQYRSVLSAIAESLEMRGGGVVAIVGRADLRGGSGYNLALGLRRAKAVYEQIAAALSTEVRAKVRVEIIDNPDADTGMGKL